MAPQRLEKNENIFDAVRLNRYLAQSGTAEVQGGSFRGGHVYVNGSKVINLATRVSSSEHESYRGRTLEPLRRLEYIAFQQTCLGHGHTPRPEGRQTSTMRCAPCCTNHLNYVGQL